MEHHFDIELACEVGVEKAILLHNLVFWIQHNEANETHFEDGHTWTYNSARAFSELMPYMAVRSITRRIKELENDGYLISSSKYNATAYDRTKWYALGPKMDNRFKLPPPAKDEDSSSQNDNVSQNNPPISQNVSSVGQIDASKKEIGQPIPYIKPDSKPIVNTDRKPCFSETENTPHVSEAESAFSPGNRMTPEQRDAYLEEARRGAAERQETKKAQYDAVVAARRKIELAGVSNSAGPEPWEQG